MDAFSAAVGAFPLRLAGEGERVRVVALARGHGLEKKLIDLGLPIGSELTVMSGPAGGGPLVVARGHARIALGHGLAHRVLVARVEDAF